MRLWSEMRGVRLLEMILYSTCRCVQLGILCAEPVERTWNPSSSEKADGDLVADKE
jgi:hypothetical protein